MATVEPAGEWSPLDAPEAIALSEAHQWVSAAKLSARLMTKEDAGSAAQLHARLFVLALAQLSTAVKLEHEAMALVGLERLAPELAEAESRFIGAAPSLRNMRDALTHFDEWSRGASTRRAQAQMRKASTPRDVAAHTASFGYHSARGTVELGPYVLEIHAALAGADQLLVRLWRFSHEVGKRSRVWAR